jgi:hypothetical protein
MVGRSIAPIRPKGNHHLRAKATDDFDHASGQHLCINAGERAIHIIRTQRMLNAQALTGQVQFLLTSCPWERKANPSAMKGLRSPVEPKVVITI